MKRRIEQDLLVWKNETGRFPLLLTGARQVGKTFLVKKFGQEHFASVAYISFDNNPRLEKVFESTINPNELLPILSAEAGVPINHDTLIIFDEVQLIPRALTSLKYFNENRPDLAVIATGSTLGVTLHEGVQFPVGKINRLALHPLTFLEFLWAGGEKQLADLIESNDKNLGVFHDKLKNLLLQYVFVGGMPLPVFRYFESKDFTLVRKTQNEILSDYRADFSKYATADFATKLRWLWDNIPAQLARENKKFLYGAVREGARARDFEAAIEWLKDNSLINIISRISTPAIPLRSHQEFNAFKIYIHDVGLLSAVAGISEKIILDSESMFREFRGALAEQFACQELVAYGFEPNYWATTNSEAEVDFIVQGRNGEIVPIEIKSGTNLRAKSLKSYMEKFQPPLAIRSSQADYKQTNNLYDVPLYLLANFAKQIL